MGFAGKNGNTELFNELCYWMGQAGASPLHLKTPGARTTLQFIYDMLHTHKILPPETVTNDYTSLLAAFQDGRIAIWPVWDSLLGASLQGNTKIAKGALAIGVPPRGPVNSSTITGAGGWAISKYSPNKDLAAKFIEYVTTDRQEAAIAQCGYSPARTSALSLASVAKLLPQDAVSRVVREDESAAEPAAHRPGAAHLRCHGVGDQPVPEQADHARRGDHPGAAADRPDPAERLAPWAPPRRCRPRPLARRVHWAASSGLARRWPGMEAA